MLRKLDTSLFKPGDRVGVAVSGGADSVALLRALIELRPELGLILSVAHFNHNLRGDESQADEVFVSDLAEKYQLALHRSEGDTQTFAKEKVLSIEAAARELRYSFFGKLIKDGVLDKVATAHTLDDQAETVLLRILRGTGTSGLAGILPILRVGNGAVVRPLLRTRRAEVIAYLRKIGQHWREDSTNAEITFTRNRLRHELLPQIAREFNPEINDALANLAEVARAEDEYWAAETAESFIRCHRHGAVNIPELLSLKTALQRRVLRLAAIQKGANLDFDHTERILKLLRTAPSGEQKTVELPNGFRAVIAGKELRITTEEPQPKNCGFSYSLSVPGEVIVPELRLRVRASLVTGEEQIARYNDDRKLAAGRLTSQLKLRNWRPGDRFWPVHTRSEKKVKELLLDRRVSSREKASWPVALAGNEIVWMRGFPVSARHAASPKDRAVIIEELPL